MTDHTTLARPYARAVFDIARESGTLAPWADVLNVAAAAVQEPSVAARLDDPACTPAQQATLLAGFLPDGQPGDATNLLRLLAENERLAVLPDIAELYAELRAAAENTLEVEVVSVDPLDEQARTTLVDALRRRLGREIQLVNTTDPAIIGGVVVKAGDLVIDGSARARLDRLASTLRA